MSCAALARDAPSAAARPQCDSEVSTRAELRSSLASATETESSSEGSAWSPRRDAPGACCVLLDWDDTLFPTTHIERHCPSIFEALHRRADGASDKREPLDRAELGGRLEEQLSAAASLLRLATSLARVYVVTMAQSGWVEVCCGLLAPELGDLIEELGVGVVYAREAMPLGYCKKAFREGLSVSQLCKQRAMRRTLRSISRTSSFAGGCASALSIGDSDAERLALQEVLFFHESIDRRGGFEECHCKTVKFMEEPRVETLLVELQIMLAWLRKMLAHEGNLDIVFPALAEADLDLSCLLASPTALARSGPLPQGS